MKYEVEPGSGEYRNGTITFAAKKGKSIDLQKLQDSIRATRLSGNTRSGVNYLEITVEGDVDPATGWFLDYGEITRLVEPLRKQLDHYYLNEVKGLENATSENLAGWIWERLRPSLPSLRRITVHETCEARCEYEGK